MPDGFGRSGVEDGFFGPTNKENAVGVPKLSYLRNNPVTRPQFTAKARKAGKAGRPSAPNAAPNKQGTASGYAKEKLPLYFEQMRPKHFFDLMITPEFLEKNMVATTNFRAAVEGAPNFRPFDLKEMYRWIGLLFINAVSPKPQFVYWFLSTSKSRIFGNDAIAHAFDFKHNGKTVRGEQRWAQLRRYLCFYDARKDPKRQQAANPLWKVASLLE